MDYRTEQDFLNENKLDLAFISEQQRTFIICLDCGKTVFNVNSDGECADCVKATDDLRNERL